MSVESKQVHTTGLVLSALRWLIGAEDDVLVVRLGFVLVVALLGGLAAVLLLAVPLFIFGILAGAMIVSFRIAVPIILHFVPVTALDWRAVPVPEERAQVSIDTVASEVESEQPDLRSHAAPDGTVTILFSDIVGSTTMTERLGARRMQEVLRAHNAIIRRQAGAHGGFEVKSIGDGFMLVFSSVLRGLECAITIQRAFSVYNKEHPDEPILVRIGLHTGRAIKEADDYYGKSITLASHIAGQAQGGQILVSSMLKELTESTWEFQFAEGQEIGVKGLASLTRVYPMVWE